MAATTFSIFPLLLAVGPEGVPMILRVLNFFF
jgi:hypothetical protein